MTTQTPEVKINAVAMPVKAYSEDEALEIAERCNQVMCEGKCSYFLTEQLDSDEWLVIIAPNERKALNAQRQYHERNNDY